MKEGISACLVFHNEGKLVERCLNSLKGHVDEIIIAHDGPCNNDTIEICKKYTENVFVRPKKGLCEFHQTFLYEKAKYSWILKLDADEFLSDELQKNIKKLIKNKKIDGYRFRWLFWGGKKYITKTFPHKLQLYRKNKIEYLGFPNWGEPIIKGNVIKSNYQIEHQPWVYSNPYDWKTYKKRNLKWVTFIQAQNHFKEPKDFDNFNYTSKIMPKTIRIRRTFPILSAPLFAIAGFLMSIGELNDLKENPRMIIKRSFLEFIKYLYFGYMVYKLKSNKDYRPKD